MLNSVALVPQTPLHQCVDEAGVTHCIKHPSPAIVLSNEAKNQFWLLLVICKGVSSSLLGLFIVNPCVSKFPLIDVSPVVDTLFANGLSVSVYCNKVFLFGLML